MLKTIAQKIINSCVMFTLAVTLICGAVPLVSHTEEAEAAQAARTNTDAEHVNFEYVPGALEWAGSQSRTGIACYIVDTQKGYKVLGPVELLWGDDRKWYGELREEYKSTSIRVSGTSYSPKEFWISETPLSNMPCPVSGDGNIWSSRSNYMKNWMDGVSKANKKLTNAAYIANEYLGGMTTVKNLKVGSGDNGDSKWKLVFETVDAHALYKKRNGKDVISSFIDGVTHKKVEIKRLKSAFAWCNEYRAAGIDITKEQRYGERGTANSKWMQAVLKSYGVRNRYLPNLITITPTSGSVPASQGIIEGWATGVANQLEIPIETSTTGGSPSEIETPNESLGTDGDCIIANFPGFYNSKGKSELIKLCFPGMLESRLWISCSYESH